MSCSKYYKKNNLPGKSSENSFVERIFPKKTILLNEERYPLISFFSKRVPVNVVK